LAGQQIEGARMKLGTDGSNTRQPLWDAGALGRPSGQRPEASHSSARGFLVTTLQASKTNRDKMWLGGLTGLGSKNGEKNHTFAPLKTLGHPN
jgi:hypothetical protein